MAGAETLYGNPLYVTRSNNLPSNIAKYYLKAVIACNSCPMDLVTDLGTESGVMAGIHSFFCNDPNSHRYVSSPRNQCIEGWWSFLRNNQMSWWIDFFNDLIAAGILSLTDMVSGRPSALYCWPCTYRGMLNLYPYLNITRTMPLVTW